MQRLENFERKIDCEPAAVSSLIRIILSRVEIHVDVLYFVLLFVIPDSCEAADRKKERERCPTTECVRLRYFAFLIWHPREKEMHNHPFTLISVQPRSAFTSR